MSLKLSTKLSASLNTLICSSLLLLSASVHATTPPVDFFDDEDVSSKSWKELAPKLPAAPKSEDLKDFYVSPRETMTSRIDLSSITVGTDGVIHYTLVITSPSGAVNTSYEGIRCETAEKKTYAYGQADGSWMKSQNQDWKRIADIQANRQQAALYKDYFCQGNTIAGKASDMINRIRNNKPFESYKIN
ncbi:MAG: CNP1-like family protein [Glaciimonas sp.]|nr:CNP1-like family protein [Glaciimonas sp.]